MKEQAGIQARSMGSFALKNVKRPMEIWAITNPGLSVPDPSKMGSRPSQCRNSVAVLPFLNMSSDRENEFFSDGITEELINALTKVRGLRVAARTSSFHFKGRSEDVREIGKALELPQGEIEKVAKLADRYSPVGLREELARIPEFAHKADRPPWTLLAALAEA